MHTWHCFCVQSLGVMFITLLVFPNLWSILSKLVCKTCISCWNWKHYFLIVWSLTTRTLKDTKIDILDVYLCPSNLECFKHYIHEWNLNNPCPHQSTITTTYCVFFEGPNKKPEGFAKQKKSAKFAMRHASQLVVHHSSQIYNEPLIITTLLRHTRQTKLCDPPSLRPP
jgi:hypothetical protein